MKIKAALGAAFFGGLIAGTCLHMPAAHADSLAQQICISIAENPTEAGVYQTFHTLVTGLDDTDAASAIADHALNDICPQWIPLVSKTARDMQALHPEQVHVWA